MARELSEKCGVFGAITTSRYAARLTYYGLFALQHRGQESSGIASLIEGGIKRHVGEGLVAHVYRAEDLDDLKSNLSIGHNRYSTSAGAGDQMQPIVDERFGFAFAHNGNLPQTGQIEEFLTENGVDFEGATDSRMMALAIGVYRGQGLELGAAIEKAWPLFTGAFACVAMDEDTLVGFRDECGIRPLSLGRLDDGYVIASETCAFDTVGAAFLRDVKPGEMVTVTAKGVKSKQVVKSTRTALDVFEYVYFARPDSRMMGRRVNEVRRQLGMNLAREYKIDADIVVPVPDSAIPAALGYAEVSGIRFDHGFIKNRYIHRTFIKPTQEMRQRDVKTKLNPVPEVVMGKRVIVIDDSIVRGTTTAQIVRMLYGAGAAEVHVLVSSPPVKFPDFYGINTPDPEELIGARMSVDEIRQHMGAESLGYLSMEGMVEATGWPKSMLSTACFDGEYPIDIGNRRVRRTAKA